MIRLTLCIAFIALSYTQLRAQSNTRKKPFTAAEFFYAGEHAHALGDDVQAIFYYDECLRMRASYTDAYLSRAISHETIENLPEALRDYTIYLEITPEDLSEVLFSRAVLHFRLKHYKQAKEDFIRLLTFPPGATTAVFFRQDLYTAGTDKMFTMQGNDKAIIFGYLGQIETKLKQYDKAMTYLDTAIRKNPHDTNLLLNRGVAREATDDMEGAASDYEMALTIDPTLSLAQYNLAQVRGKKGEPEKAKEFIEQAIINNPKLPYAFAQRAQFKLNKGDIKGAIADYDIAIKATPDEFNYLLNRGLAKEKLNDFKGANEDYTEAIELKVDFDKAWFARANLCTKLNNLSAAIDDYTITIFYNSTHSGAYYNRGLLYQRQKELKEACEDFSKAEALGMTIPSGLKELCN